MKKRLLALLLVLACILTALPAASGSDTVPCLTVDSKLVIIGDSNTVYLKKNNPDIQPARIFARVNATIAECVENWSRYPAEGYSQCINALILSLTAEDFDTVVINIGTNNAGTPTETFKEKYRILLDLLYEKKPDAVIYVCKILPINPAKYPGPYYNVFTIANINRINGAVVDLQQEYVEKGFDTRVMDLNTPFKTASGVLIPTYDSGGGIHLSTSGYHKLNEVIQTALAQGNPNANHAWEQTVLQAPTCLEAGEAQYSCSVCGAVKTEAAPALGHAWSCVEILTPSTEGTHGTARYSCSRCGETKTDKLCADVVFTDMPDETHWAHIPIDWAYFNGITTGKTATTFGPKDTCTRAQVVTFLWSAAGKPEPQTATNPFTDVEADTYYYKPVLWAVEQGITSGKTATTFAPKATCTRAEVVTFLWNAAGRPEPWLDDGPPAPDCPFTDVKEDSFCYHPMLWAYYSGVTGGTTATTFGPRANCTRAQVVTFLYKSAALNALEE